MVTGFRASLAQSIHAQAAFAPEAAAERLVFLLDYDSFYARCMQQAYPPLRGKPVGIRGPAKGTAIIAASTEAKARGVKVGLHINEALRCCPDLVPVRADMDMYGEICTKSLRVLTSYTDKVEPFSIDEAFLDATDLAGPFGDPHMLAQQIKHDLRAALGSTITCSIGIGPNKMIAKLVSKFHKPDGITHVGPEEVPSVLGRIALTDICGIGRRVERRLQRLGIYTVAQLGRFPREGLVREFGVLGHVYWLWGQGIDLSPVSPYHRQPDEKSVGHGLTLPASVSDRRQFDGILQRLCERTGRRLRRHNFLARAVSLWVGYDKDFSDGGGFGGRRVLDHVTDSGQALFQAAETLVPAFGLPAPVRHVQVTVGDLRRDALQLSLMEDRVRQRTLQQAMDAINDRFGDDAILPATILLDKFPKRDGPPGHGFCKRFEV
jgi:DNA polymerase-4